MSELTPYADLDTRLQGVRTAFKDRKEHLLAERNAARRDAFQRAGEGELARAAQDKVDADFAPRFKALEDEEARVVGPMERELQRMREEKDPSLAARRLDNSRGGGGRGGPAPQNPPREPGGG